MLTASVPMCFPSLLSLWVSSWAFWLWVVLYSIEELLSTSWWPSCTLSIHHLFFRPCVICWTPVSGAVELFFTLVENGISNLGTRDICNWSVSLSPYHSHQTILGRQSKSIYSGFHCKPDQPLASAAHRIYVPSSWTNNTPCSRILAPTTIYRWSRHLCLSATLLDVCDVHVGPRYCLYSSNILFGCPFFIILVWH